MRLITTDLEHYRHVNWAITEKGDEQFECSLRKGLQIRIIHCFPNKATRSRGMAVAKAMGIPAYEEGLCIHFDPPKNVDELNKIRTAIQTKNPIHGED
jgi:hypothetical protein